MIDYKQVIKNRELRLKLAGFLNFIPNEPYIKMVYKIKTGEKLNLKNPKTFCDKMNWLKLHDIHEEYTDLVDKVKVKEIVNKIVGEDICFPTLGVYDKYDDIDFDKLPNKFVIKCNHDSGSVKVVKDKKEINHLEYKEFFNEKLKRQPYWDGREYPYKNVIPKIFIEEYMTPEDEDDINDYKFFCFNGKPEFLFVATDRSTNCCFDFFDMDFNHLDIENIHPMSNKIINKPENFEEMKKLAEKLSKEMKFVRIDLYSIKGKIYFGEYTFFHAGGFWPLKPEKYEKIYGDLLNVGE